MRNLQHVQKYLLNSIGAPFCLTRGHLLCVYSAPEFILSPYVTYVTRCDAYKNPTASPPSRPCALQRERINNLLSVTWLPRIKAWP